jgi:hypothetical protein
MSVGQLPVVERIARELLRRLRLLLNNSTYKTKVREVVRPARLENYTPTDKQIVLSTDSIEAVPELMYPGNPPAIAHKQTFNLRCHVLLSERNTDSVESTINTFQADVIKCLTTGNEWYRFGTSAIDATIGAVEPINEDGGIDGFNLPVYITYRVDENNPYNVRS